MKKETLIYKFDILRVANFETVTTPPPHPYAVITFTNRLENQQYV